MSPVCLSEGRTFSIEVERGRVPHDYQSRTLGELDHALIVCGHACDVLRGVVIFVAPSKPNQSTGRSSNCVPVQVESI